MKLVCGIGVNDADYVVQKFEYVGVVDGKRKQKKTWTCPYYETWYSMMRRAYSSYLHTIRPTYIGCSVDSEWHSFMNFKSWMTAQEWEGNHLDKDILKKGNKVYSPNACVFVSQSVNSFMNDHSRARGDNPLGVCWHKRDKQYSATINNGQGKQLHLGYFDCPTLAHKAWLSKKLEIAKELASHQKDARVSCALIERYSVEVFGD